MFVSGFHLVFSFLENPILAPCRLEIVAERLAVLGVGDVVPRQEHFTRVVTVRKFSQIGSNFVKFTRNFVKFSRNFGKFCQIWSKFCQI